jgi:hemerythrin-like domain-containing protein
MRQIIDYFEGYLLPHATVEDHVLYAVADRKVGGPRSFTGVLRYEHRVIARWVADLSVLVRMSAPGPADARMFARRTDALLGLVRGHFESEEEVVFGMLDAVMSAEEFERDVMAKTR